MSPLVLCEEYAGQLSLHKYEVVKHLRVHSCILLYCQNEKPIGPLLRVICLKKIKFVLL